jgi:tripartite-type tricarboxylate transporter receptor subunit TctC
MNSSGADMIGKPIFLAAVAVTAIGLNAFEAVAQSYPTRPIKMILPFPPGGPIDTMGRLVAQHMSLGLGQNVYIENRAGGGSSIGMRAAAMAEPDGYTLLFASSGPLAITPALYKNLDYDPNKNFAPVATVSSGTMVLVVSPALPINSVQELVAYAKANPGKLNYGATVGTPPHLAWGLFTMLTGTDIVYVPYKGAAAAFTDLVAGQIQMNFDATGSLLPLIREGKLRALAVSSTSRNPDLPEVPTMVESGIDFLMSFWTAVLAPVGTPPDIISKLNATINTGLASAEMKATLAKFQVEAKAGSPQDFAAFLAAETKKWADVAKTANIKVE